MIYHRWLEFPQDFTAGDALRGAASPRLPRLCAAGLQRRRGAVAALRPDGRGLRIGGGERGGGGMGGWDGRSLGRSSPRVTFWNEIME